MRVFLYAGQGSQVPGMGKDLYDRYPEYREIADHADTGFDHIRLMHEGTEEELMKTEYTQGCMAVFAAGVTKILSDRGILPDAAAGLSLGEYGALYAAGVFSTGDYIRTVSFRGRAMAKASRGMHAAMMAFKRIDAGDLEEVCRKASEKGFIRIVNYNCPGQYVVCGEEEAVSEAEQYAASVYNAAGKRLKTSAPFHTPLLKSAGDDLRQFLEGVSMKEPIIPVAENLSGGLYDKETDIKRVLEQQLQSPVRFEDNLKTLIASGGTEFVEIGPGKVLAGLLKKTARAVGASVDAVSIRSAEDIEQLCAKKEEKTLS